MSEIFFDTFPVGLLGCNCTLAGNTAAGEAIVIDPGDEVEGILARLLARKVALKQIVVTHAHIDHVGGALKLKQSTGAPVLMHTRDVPLLRGMEQQAAWLGVQAPAVQDPDETLEDGAQVGVGGLPGEVLWTPGHTEGSVCLLFRPEKILLAGDTLFAGSIGRTDLWGGNGRAILRSIAEKLLPLPDETRVVPGHGRGTTVGEERERNPFLKGL